MTATRISNAAAIGMCNALVDLLDASGAGTVKIYTGPQPADPSVAVTTQTLLATLTLANPAFGNAADANPGGRAIANAIAGDLAADATGTAVWFRASDGAGVAVIDGDVGASGADMIVASTSFVAGAPVDITGYSITVPES